MKAGLLSLLLMQSVVALAQFNPDGAVDTDIRPDDVIQWEAVSGRKLPDGKISIGLRLTAKDEFTLYLDKLSFKAPAGMTLVDRVDPGTKRIIDPIGGETVDVFVGGDFELTYFGPADFPGTTFPIEVTFIGCTTKICLFPHTTRLEVPLFASADKGGGGSATVEREVETTGGTTSLNKQPASPIAANQTSATAELPCVPPDPAFENFDAASFKEDIDVESQWANALQAGDLSLGWMLLLVFAAGILTNLTPCVYPMIPITLRLLSGRSGSAFISSLLYAAGIVLTYTVLGIAATASGAMFGALLASTTFNVVFAVVMILLGLSMLGFGDLSKLQMLGNRLGAGKPSAFNTFLMGTGAGLVASPCTGPVLAALLALTAKTGDLSQGSLLLFIYSLGFGLPYVFLGSFAAKASAVKVSPKVQVGIKLLFAAVMFGLGLYYLRIPFYQVIAELRPIWAEITAVMLPLGVILAAVWLVVPRLQHDKLSMVLPTLVLGTGIFAGSQWLTASGPSAAAEGEIELTWFKTEGEAVAFAQKCGRPILVDMWAEWCEACKKMDVTTFRNPTVKRLLHHNWVLLKLDLTESTDENDAIQERYELQSLPTLVLLPPSGDVDAKQHVMGYVSAGALLERLSQYQME